MRFNVHSGMNRSQARFAGFVIAARISSRKNGRNSMASANVIPVAYHE